MLIEHAASSTTNASIGSRKRGVSTLTGAIESHHSTGIAHSHHGPRRAPAVKAPISASSASR